MSKMEKPNRQLILFTVILVILCFLSVIIFTLPTFIAQLNLSTSGNIGSAIGGLTAPVIGIATALLLYLALTKQIQSNIEQRLKNESDILFALINQLETELSTFYYTYSRGKDQFRHYGIEGLNEFSHQFYHDYSLKDLKFPFKDYYASKQILLLIRSFRLVERRIELASLSKGYKKLFLDKLDAFYSCRLHDPIYKIVLAIEKNPHIKDEVSDELELFLRNSRS